MENNYSKEDDRDLVNMNGEEACGAKEMNISKNEIEKNRNNSHDEEEVVHFENIKDSDL